MQLVCDECRDWPVTKRKIFVNYNHKLRTKRESKRRQARLASAASDQSVCDTDTDVPLEEPSVPVQDMHLDELNLGQEQCLTSEEVVVSAGTSTETNTTNLLLLPPGSDLDKLAFTVLSRLSDLQSARGPQTPVHEATTRVHEAATRVHEATSRVPEPARRVHETTSMVPEATSRVHETTTMGPKTTRWTPEMTQRTPDHPESTPMGPGRPDFGHTVPGPSRRRSFESPQRSSDRSSRQGSHTPPRKRRRHSGNSSDKDPVSQNRQHRDDQQDEEDNFRPSSLDLLLNYITSMFPAASQPLIQPSSKRFHVMESAGLVDESSQQASNLAWFGCMRSACDSAQRKFEAKVSE